MVEERARSTGEGGEDRQETDEERTARLREEQEAAGTAEGAEDDETENSGAAPA